MSKFLLSEGHSTACHNDALPALVLDLGDLTNPNDNLDFSNKASHLLNNGSQSAEGKSLPVAAGDNGGAHLDHHPLRLLQLCTSEEGCAAVAIVLDYIALEDCLTQGARRDVGKSPGNGENTKKDVQYLS